MDDTIDGTIDEVVEQISYILGIATELADDLKVKGAAKKKANKRKLRRLQSKLNRPDKPRPKRRCFKVSSGARSLEAFSLHVARLDGGAAEVEINHGGRFKLPIMLVELLLILADKAGSDADALVGWKSLKEVGRRLGQKTNKSISKQAVNQNIYRLREILDEHQYGSWRFVQTDREAGTRFALRRDAAPIKIEEANHTI